MARYYLLEFLALQITSAALAMPVNHGASTDTRQDENPTGAHSANFDEKVNKPQSRSYGRIGAKMQLFYTYLMSLNTSISASRLILGSEGPVWMH